MSDKIRFSGFVKRTEQGVDTGGMRIFVDGEPVYQSPADPINDAISVAKFFRASKASNPNDKTISETIVNNYALMALCTGMEATFKRTALEISPAEALEVLKNDNYFQYPENTKKFFKNLEIDILLCFNDWQKVVQAFKHSHKIRHVSPLIYEVNEDVVIKVNQKPIPVYKFMDEFTDIVTNGMQIFLKKAYKPEDE